jgi:hypothetical protein
MPCPTNLFNAVKRLNLVSNTRRQLQKQLPGPGTVWTHVSLAGPAKIAANALRHKLSVSPPAEEDVITWINDPRNPGTYTTDINWSYGVKQFFADIMSTIKRNEGKVITF